MVVSSSFDCRRLLQCVRRTDRLEDPPAQMLAHAVASSLLLVVAYTKHAMATQLFPMQEEAAETASVSADPLEIVWGGDIAVDDDAIISCAAIVEAPHAATTTHRSSSITSTASLLQGVLSMDDDENGDGRERDSITLSPTLALLVGTTDGRLGAVPLFLAPDATLTQGPAQCVVPPPEGLLSNGGGVQSITIRKQEVILVYNHAAVRHLPVARCFATQAAAMSGCYRRLRPPSGSRCVPRLLILTPSHQRSPLSDVLLAPPEPAEEQVLVYYPSSTQSGGGGLDAALLPTWAWYSAPAGGAEPVPSPVTCAPAAPEAVTHPDTVNDDDDDDDGILFVSLTKALVGSAVGALRWGGRPKSAAASADPHITSAAAEESLNYTMTATWHDAPRTIEQATVDPVTGHWIAMADSLGRILLVERSTRQIVRLWKGFRDASCHWLVQEGHLCLVIHSRQRRRIEVWRVRHGGRVLALAVGRDAQVLPVSGGTAAAAPCLWTAAPHRFEWMQVPPTVAAEAPSTVPRTKAPLRSAGRLKHLQQLLSLRPVTLSDVRTAVCDISAPVDLATALDVCATASVLDHAAGIQQGSSFQKEVLAHCRSVLNARGMDPAGRTNSHLLLVLQHKLEYHEKLVKAYDILYKFEGAIPESTYPPIQSPSHWAAEAMAWASTYEQVTGASFDAEAARSMERMRFSEFAGSCQSEGPKTPIYFSESSRTRRTVLERVFRPLLGDVFSINVTYSMFDALGTRSDRKYIEQCFGEWFMTLSVREACKKGLYADSPPMLRFLVDLVVRQLSSDSISEHEMALEKIHIFCTESTDLVRAFMLGALCLEAVSTATSQKEKWNRGALSTKLVNDWKSLLRKLRICLLVSLRLHGKRMAAPISIDNINQPDIFSVYEWLARDELSMSHNHEEIVSLEKACSISSYSFDPSSPEGDGPSRFKMLQSSCLAAAITEDERAEYLVDFHDEDRFGALLLFLSHYNTPKILAAHRSLLLASEWGSKPEQMDCLNDAMVCLTSLSKTPGFKSLASGVCLEIWQSQLCPIYRANLFGFTDVQELSEDVVAPLLQNRSWLTSVGRIGLQLLAILQDCKLESGNDFAFDISELSSSWPPVRPDVVLRKLVDKMPKQVEESALNIHSVVLCAFLISSDIDSLVKCVPSVSELFVPLSLFKPMLHLPNVPELQRSYLNNAIITFAIQYSGPTLDSFDLGEIVTLAKVWNFDLQIIRTLFLLAMYELGKDEFIDELVTKSSFQINGKQFVEEGVSIACCRLNMFIGGSRMRTPSLRNTVGLLDAELCEWIKQVAVSKKSLLETPKLDVALETTHLFVMRLLSISASSDVDKAMRARIHSLLVLSGILVKAMSTS